tara:strand:- start:1397 stop:3238 length:1842 start_codon:yes stop_codon:yes gene_type:complete
MDALKKYRDKCFTDLPFCLKSEYKIRSLNEETMRFDLIPFDIAGRKAQEALVKEYDKQMRERGCVRIIIDKSRKEGCSTLIQALAIHHCQTTPQAHALTVAHEDKATKELFRIQTRIVQACDTAVFPALINKPKANRIEWENGSRSECQTQGGSADSERGSTPTFLHISELPSWDSNRRNTSAADVAQAMLNAIPDMPGTVVIIESTAKGVGNLFHSMYMRAIKNERGNMYVPMFFSWRDNPIYSRPAQTKDQKEQEDWLSQHMIEAHQDGDLEAFNSAANDLGYSQLQRTRAIEFKLSPAQVRFWQETLINKCNADQDRFDEEWPLSWQISFVASGRGVFAAGKLQKRLTELDKVEPVALGTLVPADTKERGVDIQQDGGAWEIYKKPVDGHSYIVSSDAAGGGTSKEDDFAAIQVFDRATKEQVAEFYGKVPPDVLAHQQGMAAKYYGNTIMAPEANNHGLLVIHCLVKYYADQKLYRRFSEVGKVEGALTNKLGYSTDVRTRHYMFGLFESSVRRGEITLNSRRLLGEMLTLVRAKATGRPQAAPGYHDDACMALCIALDIDKQLAEQGAPAVEEKSPVPSLIEGNGFAVPFDGTASVSYEVDTGEGQWF